MPITSRTFVRSTAALLLVGLLALLGIVGMNLWLVERTQVYFDEVVEARDVRATTVNLLLLLTDAETSQRGYLLTLDPAYLDLYRKSLPNVNEAAARLSEALAPYPQAQQPLAELRANMAIKLAEMAATIDLATSGDQQAAVARVMTDEGKAAMDSVRTFLDAVIAAADSRLTAGVEDQRGSANLLRIVAVVGALVILAVIAGAIWAVLAYTGELRQAREAVEAANSGLEERVRERTADLGKANEEIQRFAYIVTHDLRAPLVNIMGFTSELETSVATLRDYMAARPPEATPDFEDARLAATEDLPEAIGFIRAATRKMDGLINAILKISREGRRQLKPEPVDLAALVDASSAAVHHQVSDVGGTIDTDIRVGQIVSDRLSLEQVLGNLLDNAVKYAETTRPLRIAIRARHLPGNRVVIEVEDNGRGIADTDHERVFELFRRSGAQTKPGEGIGLAHVRTMVRSLGGDVTLRSVLGEGTTFIINLPRDSRVHLGSTSA